MLGDERGHRLDVGLGQEVLKRRVLDGQDDVGRETVGGARGARVQQAGDRAPAGLLGEPAGPAEQLVRAVVDGALRVLDEHEDVVAHGSAP